MDMRIQQGHLMGPLLNNIPLSPIKRLNAIETLAKHALSAIDEYEKGHYSLFDPSIGDESCQIRALMMLETSLCSPNEELQKARIMLKELIMKVTSVLSNMNEEIDQKELVAKQKKTEIALKKKGLNEDKTKNLEGYKRGSPEHEEIMNLFKVKMKALSDLEEPINRTLKEEREMIDKQALSTFPFLDPVLSKKIRQIILCYVLNKAKSVERDVSNPLYKTVHDKFRVTQLKIDGIPFDAAVFEKITDQAKNILNTESVEFLIEESKKLKGKRSLLISHLMEKPMPSKKKFSEVSFYHGCDLVMKRTRALGIPIIVKSRDPKCEYNEFNQVLCYTPRGDNHRYGVGNLVQDAHVLVIEGASQRASSEGLAVMIEEAGGLMKMIKLNLAEHRLCTGHSSTNPSSLLELGVPKEEIDRIEAEQKISQNLGYCESNMANFRIEHMYADTVSIEILEN